VGSVAEEGPGAEVEAIWGRVREDLRASLPAATFKLWLEPLRAVGAQGRTLYIAAPRETRAWVERRYLRLVGEAVRRNAGGLEDVGFAAEVASPTGERDDAAAELDSLPLDPAHTFENFVIGPGNRLAHAAALAVAELPGEAYNPLFLHGPPGLGKTHLLGAIADYLRRLHPEMTVHYTTAERFTGEFVTALRREGPERFKRRYRALDALLIDDVQVLEGKARTEEEFVHTFNTLHAAGKQIVLSSDRPPDALAQLADRLRDRFAWGLCLSLDAPDLRTRTLLLARLAQASPVGLADPAALRELASRVPGNVRRLEGAMTRVVAFASMLRVPVSGQLVRRALVPAGGMTRAAGVDAEGTAEGEAQPDIAAIQEAVCRTLHLSMDDLLSAKRTPAVSRGRQLAMYLARDLTGLSLAQIAAAFNRDHTTVMHALRAVEGRLEPGSETSEALHRVRLALHRPSTSPSTR
jgi:chromosomal replication initiator protein